MKRIGTFRLLALCGWIMAGGGAQGAVPAANLNPVAGCIQASRPQIELGIDVLAADGFSALRGKRVGLLTHPAGVNREGVSTVDVLRRAPEVRLAALFGPEHGIYGNEAASVPVADRIDRRTGLPVYSLYGKYRKPTPAMLKGLDALVIDLQDVGTRCYTFISCMRYAMEACFEQGVEVIILDRPNPLGGLKTDGPPLDPALTSYVGAFPVPFVHGLTMGELARLAKAEKGVMAITDEARGAGKLTIIPMRGWTRAMRWPETGLRWTPTSPNIPTWGAVAAYPMTGLGQMDSSFRHGVGGSLPFQVLTYAGRDLDDVASELLRARIRGLTIERRRFVNGNGDPAIGLYLHVTDWDAWRPTELSFHMMRINCRLAGRNPYVRLAPDEVQLFNKHTGSLEWWRQLSRLGADVPVEKHVDRWSRAARDFRERSRRYWLYQ